MMMDIMIMMIMMMMMKRNTLAELEIAVEGGSTENFLNVAF